MSGAGTADGLPPFIGFAGLWRLDLSGMDMSRLGPLLEARLARNAQDAAAMMDIATLSLLTLLPENRAPAFALQTRALEIQQVFTLPAARQPTGIRILAFMSPGDMTAVTPLDCLVEDSDVELQLLYARADAEFPRDVPAHDVVFVAVGESGPNRPLLEKIAGFLEKSPKPVVNAPEYVLGLSRDRVSKALSGIPGIVMPATVIVGRTVLEGIGQGAVRLSQELPGGEFPVIARPVDSQGGKDLDKLDAPEAIRGYLERTDAGMFYISRFVDYSGQDGMFRKYRVVMIDGRPFACHMAISRHWMIHYVNADMDQDQWKREEEARFMADFDAGFATPHAGALKGIDEALGLDYYAIDCGETRDGKLVVFEADTAMLVHAMDSVDLYPYKQRPMRKIFDAFRGMLEKRRAAPGQ